MKRIDIDKTIKAKTIEKASEKFAKVLTKKGYDWAGAEMVESVDCGYPCCSNATEHELKKGTPTSPKSKDWTYYWAIQQLDENTYYAWFIDRGYN